MAAAGMPGPAGSATCRQRPLPAGPSAPFVIRQAKPFRKVAHADRAARAAQLRRLARGWFRGSAPLRQRGPYRSNAFRRAFPPAGTVFPNDICLCAANAARGDALRGQAWTLGKRQSNAMMDSGTPPFMDMAWRITATVLKKASPELRLCGVSRGCHRAGGSWSMRRSAGLWNGYRLKSVDPQAIQDGGDAADQANHRRLGATAFRPSSCPMCSAMPGSPIGQGGCYRSSI